MRIIISPAKKMNDDLDSFSIDKLPQFLKEAEELKAALCKMSFEELRKLWRCNDAIAALNVERLRGMDLRRRLTPAILAYEGIQYQYMAPRVLETEQLGYLQEHLRILSGLYGLLRPFDGVTPYRLEMQARLPMGECKDLYQFWGGKLGDALAAEAGLVVNLASKEYSRTVEPHLPSKIRFLTCTFGEWNGEKLLEKGTMCKMARGRMVRWLAENNITDPEDIRYFADLNYQFAPAHSTENNYVFIQGGT